MKKQKEIAPHEILTQIFAVTPLPNNLKNPKQKWLRGELGPGAIISIIEKYSNFTCRIVCEAKPPAGPCQVEEEIFASLI